ncbi:MAG: hypothetical protein ABI222_16015 [Opitutaceae bacterium]
MMEPSQTTREEPRPQTYYRGYPMIESDLIKEIFFTTLAVLVLVVALALVFSSPDEGGVTIQRTAQDDPLAFAQSTLSYLDGSADLTSYGPPYTNGTGAVQSIGFFSPQTWAGVALPVDPARDFVLHPLQVAAQVNAPLASALTLYEGASAAQHQTWTSNLTQALAAPDAGVVNGAIQVAPGDYGPVLTMLTAETNLGLSGALDGLLGADEGKFFQVDYTHVLLFVSTSETMDTLATNFNLQGNQWGVMNETGNWPGQAWLWLYTSLYQVPPFTGSWAAFADLAAVLTMGALSLILLLVPWLPGLRNIPRLVRVYRLIWRAHYRRVETPRAPGASSAQ